MKKVALVLMVVGLVVFAAGQIDTVQAGHSDGGCHSCHTVHRSTPEEDDGPGAKYGVPLWSEYAGTTTGTDPDSGEIIILPKYKGTVAFDPYQGSAPREGAVSTFNAINDIGTPNGPSLLCLGCHDGTYGYIAYGGAKSGSLFTRDDTSMALKHSHPVSFVYDAALVAADPELRPITAPANVVSKPDATIQSYLLDSRGRMQCTSCHDPHVQAVVEGQDLTEVPELHWDNTTNRHPADGGAPFFGEQIMCTTCHIK